MSNVLVNVICHIVFSTKNREPLIAIDKQDELFRYMGGVIGRERAIAVSIGGVEDHVHVLAKLPVSRPISEIVGRLKGSSSRWIEQQPWFEGGFAWQRGYAVFSVSQSLVERVRRYIARQREHHERVSFSDELNAMLELHGLEPPPVREAR
jgi:REP element-mobilizing transposase RayT